jgi:hypothetical protein
MRSRDRRLNVSRFHPSPSNLVAQTLGVGHDSQYVQGLAQALAVRILRRQFTVLKARAADARVRGM